MKEIVLTKHEQMEQVRTEGLTIINRFLEQIEPFKVEHISNCRTMIAEVQPDKTIKKYTEMIIKLRRNL